MGGPEKYTVRAAPPELARANLVRSRGRQEEPDGHRMPGQKTAQPARFLMQLSSAK